MDLLSGDEKTSDWISCKVVGVKESRVGEGQAGNEKNTREFQPDVGFRVSLKKTPAKVDCEEVLGNVINWGFLIE